ncbi:MAG TPA: hypothetical protein VLR69_04950, partial [Thermoanaerobaculia bacterium]|nr:hypothetical protein [Thermoanaerobaculia bacterium]
IPPRFQVIDSRIDTNDSTKWTVTCDSQVATANMASYEIHLIVNGQRFMHDPSIAVTTDPIPPTSTPWPPGGKGAKPRLAAQRVEEG